MKLINLFLFFIKSISFTNNPKTDNNKVFYKEPSLDRDSPSSEKSNSEIFTDTVLAFNKTFHTFSDKIQMDTFLITLRGKSLTEGMVIFTIIDYTGNEIYKITFPSNYLFNYDLKNEASKQDEKTFILGRIKQFFKDENFKVPAINPSDKFDSDYSEKEIWDEIQADQSAIGFFYLVGEEDGRSIAYSKKLKKAVMYFNCC
jgi:hypothetical protein